MNPMGLHLLLTLILYAIGVTSRNIKSNEEPPPHCVIETQQEIVICRTFENFDIRKEFERISSTLPSDGKLFDQLIIYYLPVHELPENAFFDLQFTQISIHQTYNLTSIHSNAFNGTSNITEHFYLSGTNNLVNNPPDYDLYAAISSLTNLKTVTICLSGNQKHEIPEKAFRQINGPQNSLQVIEFRGDFIISRINDSAFSEIPSINRSIVFSYIQIEYISEKALDFSQSSEDRLEIHLNGCGLNESSFADNVLSGTQRPLYVNLDNNNIRLIKESTFANFLTHPNTSISFANNRLDCDDSRTQFQWLLDRKNQSQNRILNATCSDGISLWDIDNADYCNLFIIENTGRMQCNDKFTSSLLKTEFKRIAHTFPSVIFDNIEIWNNQLLTELPDNLLMGLNVSGIDVQNSHSLRYIHRNAFQTSFPISVLTIYNNPLINSPLEFDIYYALVLSNAVRINFTLDHSIDHTIPDNAFHSNSGAQNKLQTLFIGFNRLLRIGRNMINDITALNAITFTGNRIESIASNAFDYESPSDTALVITFQDLNYIGFGDNMFSGSRRPIRLQFSNDYSLQYIDENIFSAFFSVNAQNQLIIDNTSVTLNCTDIEKFVWLLRQKQVLRDKIQNPMCSDNTLIWDLDFTDISWPTNILLIMNNVTDIREEFRRISDSLPDDQKQFAMLELYYAPITELPENCFVDISFREIYLYELYNLTTINTNAFNGNENSIEILQLIGTTNLINSPPNGDLYAAISSLINLKSVQIELAANVGHEIPQKAFQQINGPQNSLENITFTGELYWITKINDNAFSAIPNLKTIVFTSITINFISTKAFDFDQSAKKSNDDLLEIELNGCALNESSFDNDVFANSRKPLFINLNSNQLQYLRETSFSEFINANPLNKISLENNPLNCDNITHYEWILSRKTELENRVLNARCSNGINLWDLELPQTQTPEEATGMSATETDSETLESETDNESTLTPVISTVESTITPVISTLTTSVTQTTVTTSTQTPLETVHTTTEFLSTTAATPLSTTTTTSILSTSTTVAQVTTTTTTTQTSIIPSTTATPDLQQLCNEDFSYNGQYYISRWPPVRPGETSYGECQTGYIGIAMWLCRDDYTFDTNGPQINCTQSWIDDLHDIIIDDNITSIAEVIKYISLLDKDLNENDITYYVELVKFVEMVEKLQFYSHIFIDSNQYLNEAKIISTNLIDIYSNLLSRAKPWIEANQFESSVISERLVLHVQYASFLLGCQLNITTAESITRNNIYVENFKLNETTGYTLESSRTNSTIIIPANVDINFSNLPQFCPERTAFAVIYDRIDDYFNWNLIDDEMIASNIIGFSFTNDTKTYTLNSGKKAKIILEHKTRLSFGDKIRCAFWDYEANNWSSDGSERIANESNRDITTCQCNHLTNFAAIIDISGRQTNDRIKSALTINCSSVSCICIIMTFVVMIMTNSKNHQKEKNVQIRDSVTCNLCVCLLVVNLLVIFGMGSTSIKWLCQTSSGLLLYSLLSAFCWMLLEGFYLYRITVTVFYTHYRYLNYIFAYGMPVIVIVIGFGIVSIANKDIRFFDSLFIDESVNYFCWISSEQYPQHIWIFAAPVVIVMAINIYFLTVSMISVFRAVNQNRTKLNYMWIIAFTSLLVFLGLTWLLFILYIRQIGLNFIYFDYVFIVLNGSQGVFIFIFQTIHNTKALKKQQESSYGINIEIIDYINKESQS